MKINSPSYELRNTDCLDAYSRFISLMDSKIMPQTMKNGFVAGYNAAKFDLEERNQTIAMLSQQLADKKEIIRRLTT